MDEITQLARDGRAKFALPGYDRSQHKGPENGADANKAAGDGAGQQYA